jgi:hypothetical protein
MTNRLSYLSALLALGCLAAQAATTFPGIEELYRLDRLPELKQSVKVASISSYDRTGGNDDGFSGKYSFVRKEGDALVIADLTGPGVIYRVWTPTPTDDPMEFLFDGESKPRIVVGFRDLFLGKHPSFPSPLVGFGAGGYFCYAPISFAKSCVVRVRAPKVQFYQINYAIYDASAGITTFSETPDPSYREHVDRARELFASTGSDITRFTAPPGAKLLTQRATVDLAPGATQTLAQVKGGGRIVGLRLSPADALAGKARDILLRISFDGEAPAVLCPAGDFFGAAWGQPAARSLLVGNNGDTDYCYFPMPFDRNARIELVSERATPVQVKAEVVHTSIPRRPNEAKFYALWRRENPTRNGEPYTFLQTEGRGHLVGLALQAQGFEPGRTPFFEGDDQTTIDGELVIHGTGSEDFFNGGWYDVPDRWEKRLSFPLSGCLGYFKQVARSGAYRLFLGDAYAFRRSLLQAIEHAPEKNSTSADYCSVTWFYSEKRPTAPIAVPPLKDRAVVDPTEAVFPAGEQTPIYAWSYDNATLTREKERLDSHEVRVLSFNATGSDWFGPHFLSPTCDLPAAGTYAIYLEVVKGPTQAIVQLFQNENPAGEPVDLYAAVPAKSGRLLLGKLQLAEGKNNLMLKLVGKNEKSSGLGLDLVQTICVREP